ncbi:MAG: FAD-dependent oxidoreductase [Pirellula sp.]
MRIVVVGGVAGGASAAARARRVDADAEIVILEKGRFISFANCGLPYHVGGEIADRNKLLVATPELFWNRFRVEVRTEHEVTVIDRSSKVIHFVDHATGKRSSLEYDRLILSTGSEPVAPPVLLPLPSNAFHLWTLNDMDRILACMSHSKPSRAIVIRTGCSISQLAHHDPKMLIIET